jgi:pimeloyl-ACP methyl ester carboxylesterase
VPPGSLPHIETFEHGGAALVAEVLTDSSPVGPGLPDRPDVPDLVFLHGWGASRESLRGIAILFQHVSRVHLIDLPGFGDAALPPRDWSTVEYADLVQQYLASRMTRPFILVGHSFGGRLTIRLAARHLTNLTAVVLMGTPGLPAAGWSRVRVRRSGIRALRRLMQATRGLTGPGPLEWHTRKYGSKDYLAAGELRQVLVRTVNENLTDIARQVECPALLIWGTDDTETPPALAFRYRDLMRGPSSVVMLPHKDHYLYSGTGAHLCAFKMRQWLGQAGGPGLAGQAGVS